MLVVDTGMVKDLGTSALAAMQVVGPSCYLVVEIVAALGVGAIATVSRATGEGDPEKRRRAGAAAMRVAAVAGLLAGVAGAFLLPFMVEFFRSPGDEAIAAEARKYLFAFALSIPFLVLDTAASAVLRGAGDSRTPMATALIGNVVNIAGNWALIYGNWGAPALGMYGAGVATAMAFAVQGLLTTGFLATRWSAVRLGVADAVRAPREEVRRLLAVTGPALAEPVILRIGFLIFVKSVSMLGEVPMAAHRAAITVESLSFMPGYGLSIACSALVGRHLGAGRPDLAERSIRESVKLGVLFMSGLGVVFLLFAEPLVGIFLPAGAGTALALGAGVLRIAAVEQPFMAAAFALRGALRGAGDTRSSLAVGAACIWGIRVPLAFLLAFPLGLGLVGIWITMIVDWAGQAAGFAWRVRRGGWKRVNL